MAYGKEHKIVLQTIMHEGVLSEDRGKELVTGLFGHDNAVQIINKINEKLEPLCMAIKYINCEITGQLYWVFTSTVQDKSASFHLEFSQTELTLLRNIYSEIVTSTNGYVSSTWCLNLCSSLNLKLTKIAAEEFLQEIVKRNWLSSKDGNYYMGVRSIGELLQYFKDTYEDSLRICILCKQALFYGEKCNKCDNVTHIHCLKDYMSNHGDLGCPNCLTSEHLSSTNTNSTMDIDMLEMTQPSQKRSKRIRI